jgi:hypothetical protein
MILCTAKVTSCFNSMNPDTSILENIILSMDCSMNKSPLRVIVGDIIGVVLIIISLHFIERLFRFATNCIFNLDFNIHIFFKKSKKLIGDEFYSIIKNSSFVKSMIDKEQKKIEISFDKVLVFNFCAAISEYIFNISQELKSKSRSIATSNSSLPETGLPHSDILDLMKNATKTENIPWETGHVVCLCIFLSYHDM